MDNIKKKFKDISLNKKIKNVIKSFKDLKRYEIIMIVIMVL